MNLCCICLLYYCVGLLVLLCGKVDKNKGGDCFKCWNTEVKNDVCIMGAKITDLMVGGVNDEAGEQNG